MLAFVMCAVLTATPAQLVEETITVSRILVDVRVVDFGGSGLITDLTAADFDVLIDGKPVVVESAEWIYDVGGSISLSTDDDALSANPAGEELIPYLTLHPSRRGRLFVVFVQTDFRRHPSYVSGHMKFLPYALEMIGSLEPADRVAVFSFDSHLKFRLDFTTDREAAQEAMRNTIYIDDPAPPGAVPEPALGSRLSQRAMRDARDSEGALHVIANALKTIPGTKTILLIGKGLGELTPTGVHMKRRWKGARAALEAARVTLFSIDTTYADIHDLAKGLEIAAHETGGMYVQTYNFPRTAMLSVLGVLQGRYELVLRAPELKRGSHTLSVRTRNSTDIVLAPTSVLIRD